LEKRKGGGDDYNFWQERMKYLLKIWTMDLKKKPYAFASGEINML